MALLVPAGSTVAAVVLALAPTTLPTSLPLLLGGLLPTIGILTPVEEGPAEVEAG